MAVGGSTTMGLNANMGNYPAHLRARLRNDPAYPGGVEVINAGVAGWVSDQSALWAETELARYTPDIVILDIAGNDFQIYSPVDSPPSLSYFRFVYGWRAGVGPVSALKSVTLAANFWTHLEQRAKDRLDRGRPHELWGPGQLELHPAEKTYRFYIENVARLAKAFRAANPNVRIAILTMTARWPLETDAQYESGNGKPSWAARAGVPKEAMPSYLERLNRITRQAARDDGLLLIDFSAAFAPLDRPRLMTDFAHMNGEGYALMADIVLADLVKAGWVDTPKPDLAADFAPYRRAAP